MISFLCTTKPLSVNAHKKPTFYSSVVNSFQRHHRNFIPLTGPLYGFVYYFVSIKSEMDADNISKPVWDALRSIAYADDKQIKYRSAGVFDLTNGSVFDIDVSGMADSVLTDFLYMVNNQEEHILYIEIGEYKTDLFQFGYSD